MVPMIDAPARSEWSARTFAQLVRRKEAPVRSGAPAVNKAVFLACISQWQRVIDTADPRRSCGK